MFNLLYYYKVLCVHFFPFFFSLSFINFRDFYFHVLSFVSILILILGFKIYFWVRFSLHGSLFVCNDTNMITKLTFQTFETFKILISLVNMVFFIHGYMKCFFFKLFGLSYIDFKLIIIKEMIKIIFVMFKIAENIF